MDLKLITFILLSSLIHLNQAKLGYNEARYIIQYEKKLEKCIQDIGYFSCGSLGKSIEIQQNCLNALRTYDQCILTDCFDAEYIAVKQGISFNYLDKYYDYAMNASGLCERDPIVVKYSNKNQSTKNYIEEKQNCFDKNAIVFNPNKNLTDIDENMQYCIKTHPQCDEKCTAHVKNFNTCLYDEEKKFVVYKNFWNLKSVLPEFKTKIFQTCSSNMRNYIELSPQFSHYTHCIQKQLNSSSSSQIIHLNITYFILGFLALVNLI